MGDLPPVTEAYAREMGYCDAHLGPFREAEAAGPRAVELREELV